MQNEPTNFEERTIKNQGSLPSITFCEDSEDDDFTKMQDILDAIAICYALWTKSNTKATLTFRSWARG